MKYLLLEHDNMCPTIIVFEKYVDEEKFRTEFDIFKNELFNSDYYEYDYIYQWINEKYPIEDIFITDNMTKIKV